MDILKIKQFLKNSYNNNYGYGFGSSNGCGDSCGYGCGYGTGYGSIRGDALGISGDFGYGVDYGYDVGIGIGFGDGDGYSHGIKSINGYDIYRVDDIVTIFTHIFGNVAKGFILEKNVILKPCYIVKGNGYFAHGKTLKDAQSALEEKILDNTDIEEKIKLFKKNFPCVNKKYPVKDFYHWHHTLTGSCEMGRKTFAKNHNIDIDNDTITVKKFIDLTENAYCGGVIKKLKGTYKNETSNDK